MMSEKKLNIELFKKIRDRIAEVPESYDQSTYVTEDHRAPCGTAACLAGAAIICNAVSVKAGIRSLRHHDDRRTISQRAAKLLGLPRPNWGVDDDEYNSAALLFYSSSDYKVGWPEPFGSTFNKARGVKSRAEAAVAYLDHIIETGKVLE